MIQNSGNMSRNVVGKSQKKKEKPEAKISQGEVQQNTAKSLNEEYTDESTRLNDDRQAIVPYNDIIDVKTEGDDTNLGAPYIKRKTLCITISR